jgi:lysophospholipase L1-like esterase
MSTDHESAEAREIRETFRPPTHPDTARRSARSAITVIAVTALVLLLFQGPGLRKSGKEMDKGVLRTLVLAIGEPAGWLGDQLPLDDVADDATAWLSTDEDLDSDVAGFAGAVQQVGGEGVPPVPPESFDPRDLGEAKPPQRALRHLLVTGDSMSQPLDSELARRLADGRAIQVTRDPHLGSGISKTFPVDWAKLARRLADREKADAVVMFLGANEGFPLTPVGGTEEVECCVVGWAQEYAFRVRQVMNTLRRDGQARVYWLTLPLPRDPERRKIASTVNAAIRVAVQPYRAQARVVEMEALFTPNKAYRESIDGTLVRESDGIHLNDAGAKLAADPVLKAIEADFRLDG